jgi:RNA polymerase sigma-70 factor (sigma-E family)
MENAVVVLSSSQVLGKTFGCVQQNDRPIASISGGGGGGIEVEAFLVARGAALLRFAYLLTRDTGRAEDLVQDALAKTYRRWTTLEHPEAYVRRAIVNEHLSWRRRRAASEVIGDVPETPVAAYEPDAVWSVLGRLPRRQQTVMVLRYYEDLSDAEIATILGCAAGTVRSLASRAFDALRADPSIAALSREEQS